MKQKSFLIGAKVCSIVVISIFMTACGESEKSGSSLGISESVKLEKVTGIADSEWKSFGATYANSTYTRSYKGESYIYVVPKEAGAGSYKIFSTELGETYEVSAELIGADVNSNEHFEASSYITASRGKPLVDEGNVIGISNKVSGGEKVIEKLTFVATGQEVYIALRSDKGWTYASGREISIKKVGGDNNGVDTIKPVILLNGQSLIEIKQGSTYQDAGAIANDNKDGDITSKIVTVNPVDTSKVGTYTITYNVKDVAKNKAVEVRRTVKVVADDVVVNSCSELINNAHAWLAFGNVYDNSAYLRSYNGEIYNYIAAKEPNAGLYKSFTTKIGAKYKVSAELLGADVNQDKYFDASSFVTISSALPSSSQAHVIASSDKVTGNKKEVKSFTFVATSTISYIGLRSDRGWMYANVRAVSVKELADECGVNVEVPPVAISKHVILDKNTNKEITLLGTDANGDSLTYSITTEPIHGLLVLDGNLATYTPTENYVGSDSFEFNVNDGTDDSEPATVTITVRNIINPSTGKPWDHGNLKVSDDKRMLQHEDGTGFFWSADTAWFVPARMTREEMGTYLTNRAEKGFTVVQVNIMSLVWQRNAYGDYPFPVVWQNNEKDANGVEIPHSADNSEAFKIDQLLIKEGNQVPDEDYDRILGSADPSISPLPYEERMAYIKKFEDDTYDYWDNVEYLIDKAEEKGIYIAIVVAWGGHVDEFIKEDRTIYEKYIKDLTRLYKNKPNIIWLNGGDVYNTNLMQKPQWDWIGEALKTNDQNHLVSFHGHPSSFAFQDKSWLDFNMLESGHGLNTAEQNNFIINDYAITSPVIKPTVDAETRYEEMTPHGTNVVLPKEDRIKPKDVREIEYYQLFSGAFGVTYGHNSVWQVSWQEEVERTGENGYVVRIHPLQTWEESLDSPGAFQMQFLSELMRSRPILGRVPNQSLLVDAETTAKGTLGNGYAMVYSTSGESLRVALDKVSGSKVNIWSYNPRTGEAKLLRQNYHKSGFYTFVPEDSKDWVVVIDDASKGYGKPGMI